MTQRRKRSISNLEDTLVDYFDDENIDEYIHKRGRFIDEDDDFLTENLISPLHLSVVRPKIDYECSICLEHNNPKLYDNTFVSINCPKKHVFHKECITEWSKSAKTCPLCRGNFTFSSKKLKRSRKKSKKTKRSRKKKMIFKFGSNVCTICSRPACQTMFLKNSHKEEHFCKFHKINHPVKGDREISNTCK